MDAGASLVNHSQPPDISHPVSTHVSPLNCENCESLVLEHQRRWTCRPEVSPKLLLDSLRMLTLVSVSCVLLVDRVNGENATLPSYDYRARGRRHEQVRLFQIIYLSIPKISLLWLDVDDTSLCPTSHSFALFAFLSFVFAQAALPPTTRY